MGSRFVGHEPCPKCGSKDNLGRYQDGTGWCFGCGYFEGRKADKFDPKAAFNEETVSTKIIESSITNLYKHRIGEEAVLWLKGYDIEIADAIKFGWVWNPKTKQLIFPFKDDWDTFVCFQARNFDTEAAKKAKYRNFGEKSKHLTIYQSNVWWKEDALVLVEDAVSAAKVSRIVDSYPILGSSITKETLVKFKDLFYEEIYVWLDYDKFKEACKIQSEAKALGFNAHVILTNLDPKYYNVDEIRGYIGSLHD